MISSTLSVLLNAVDTALAFIDNIFYKTGLYFLLLSHVNILFTVIVVSYTEISDDVFVLMQIALNAVA